MTDYLSLAKEVVNRAAARGVEAEALIMDERATEIRVSRQQVERLSQSGSLGLGVRVIARGVDGGRVGYAYTSDLSPQGVDATWQAAVDLAAVASADPNRALPEPQPIPTEDLEIWDRDLPTLAAADKIAFARQMEQAALDHDPRIVMSQWCTYGDAIEHIYLANSRGFAGDYGHTAAYGMLDGIARDENGMTSGTGLGFSTFFRELDAQAIGREAAQRAVQILGGQPVDTQRCTVVFDAVIVGQILSSLAPALTAQAMQRGRSFLIGKMGQEIGSDKVTLMDNGRLKRGLASAPFDGEGVPTSATRLIDEGILQHVIYDSYTARREGVRSTGNAQRGSHRSLPMLGPSNFYMQPGNLSQQELIAGVKDGFFVTSIMQTGGIDPITGDCSMGAGGMWIENGKLTRPINGVTVATTLSDLLKNIVAVGSDLRVVPFGGAIGAPTICVENVTLGGKS